MGIFAFLRRLLFGAPHSSASDNGELDSTGNSSPAAVAKRRTRPRLVKLRRQSPAIRTSPGEERTDSSPYSFATPHVAGGFLDLSRDGNAELLVRFGLPQFETPAQIAEWAGLTPGQLAWLSGRFYERHRPLSVADSHYHYRWLKKRSQGHRLIEAPKPRLKALQQKILREILDRVPAHPRAFGFVAGRSAVMNANEHVGQYVLLKLDLQNFYTSVRYSRVVAIFRSLGYSRVVALWLARLTTTAAPASLPFPDRNASGIVPYLHRHLPQGAPTSPALANLSAFGLDVRLQGLAAAYHATYSRYADDLTISGSHRFAGALREVIPLVGQIIRDERFVVNHAKRKVVRRSARQSVTGVVVNEHLNAPRSEYDRLKAILHNCAKLGPASQNRDSHPHFAEHLAGRIAYLASLNAARAEKLKSLYGRVDWSR